MMGVPILEALPSRAVPYERVDPFILVPRRSSPAVGPKGTWSPGIPTEVDNLWYVLEGSVSTGHNTGLRGAMERPRLSEGRS